MVIKEKLHLGQEVLVQVEDRQEKAVIDGLTQNYAGVIIMGGPLMLVEYEDMFEL